MRKRNFKLGKISLALMLFSTSASAECQRSWVFFDLGNTLVDTATYNFEKTFYMPEAHEYLEQLKQRGNPLALIVNVPDHWGASDGEKIETMKKSIAESWSDARAMDWTFFQMGILVPPHISQSKPQPFLFEKALKLAQASGCSAIYQGENEREIAAAQAIGMRGYLTGVKGKAAFMPIEEIDLF